MIDELGPLNGRITKNQNGSPQFVLLAGNSVAEASEVSRQPAWMAGLRFKSDAPAKAVPYWEYLNRGTAGQTAAKASGRPIRPCSNAARQFGSGFFRVLIIHARSVYRHLVL